MSDALADSLSALRRYRAAVERYFALRGRQLGLHSTDISALAHIADSTARHETLSPGELGQLLALSGPATTAVLDRLERVGYVERRRDDHDGRRLHIISIEQSLHEHDLSYDAFFCVMRDALAGFSPREQELFSEMLTTLTSRVETVAPAAETPSRRSSR